MEKQGIRSKRPHWWVILVSVLVLHLYLLFNLKFTAWPEMTFWPYLILKGWLPYRDIAIAHTPLLISDLSIFYRIFGLGLMQLKIYTWILILSIDLVLFFVVKELWNKKVALLTVLFYVIFQLFYEGNGLWFDLPLGLVFVIIFYLTKKGDWLWAGLFWALSFLYKQTAFWFLFPLSLTVLKGEAFKKLKGFATGALLVFVPGLLLIWLLEILPDFLFWTVKFGIGILPKASGQVNLPTLRQLAVSLLPFSVLFFLPFVKNRKNNLELVVWAFFGSLGTFPRWEMFHFQPAIPFVAIAAGIVFSNVRKIKPIARYLLGIYLILGTVLVFRHLSRDWRRGDRFFEPEILRVTSYIGNNTDPNDKIYVLNAWDSVYTLSDTLPAVCPWVPHLPWYMELPGVQEEIVRDLEKEQPEMIVMREYSESGLSSYRPELIDKFVSENYEMINNIDGYLILSHKK